MTPGQRQQLEALGVNPPAGVILPGDEDPLVAFEIDEEHPNWLTLRTLVGQWDAGDFVGALFSEAEIAASRWLLLGGGWLHGYPQPNELDNGFLEATYDLKDYCSACGAGGKQKAPFQMKDEPKWGRRSIMQLNWIHDEIFVKPDVWASVFKPFGIRCRPVINVKGAELKTVVQLVADEEVAIVADGLAGEKCSTCGRMKYFPITRDAFPAPVSEPSGHIARTKEYFGSGGEARTPLLVSQAVGRALRESEVRGVSYIPFKSYSGTKSSPARRNVSRHRGSGSLLFFKALTRTNGRTASGSRRQIHAKYPTISQALGL